MRDCLSRWDKNTLLLKSPFSWISVCLFQPKLAQSIEENSSHFVIVVILLCINIMLRPSKKGDDSENTFCKTAIKPM